MPSLVELRAECVKYGLVKSGNKPDLVRRLAGYHARQAAASSCAAAAETSSSSCAAAETPSQGVVLSSVTGKPVPYGQGEAWPTHVIRPEGATVEQERALMAAAHRDLEQHVKAEEEKAADAEFWRLRRLTAHAKHDDYVKKHGYMGIAALRGAFVDSDLAPATTKEEEKKEEQEGKDQQEDDGKDEQEQEEQDEDEQDEDGEDSASMQVFVKIVSQNKTITLTVEPSDTVRTIKALIFSKESIPRGQQRLVFGNVDVEDDRVLNTYGIKEGSSLTLVLLAKKQISGFRS